MNGSSRRWATAVWALGAAVPAVQASEDTITWAIIDRPPMMIVKDGVAPRQIQDLGDGSADQGIAQIAKRLPGYRHEFQLTNGQRVWGAMERGQNLCYAAALKTPERLPYVTFTPFRLVSPLMLVVHKSRLPELVGSAREISLSKVIANFAAEGRLEDKRSYGPQLDAVLAEGSVRRELVVATSSLLKPLANGLFGYTLEYPQTVQYMMDSGQIPRTLETVELKENTDWLVSYVACTRNAWGDKTIRDIDRAIRQASATQAYRAAVTRWTPAKHLRGHQSQLQAYFDERAAGAPRID